MITKEVLQQFADEGYTKRETAEILGIGLSRLNRMVTQWHVVFKTSHVYSKERKKLFLQLYDAGEKPDVIIRRVGISRATYENWVRDILNIRAQVKPLMVGDPRSKVCQQIRSCGHSRCHLSVRCPAYHTYLKKRTKLQEAQV